MRKNSFLMIWMFIIFLLLGILFYLGMNKKVEKIVIKNIYEIEENNKEINKYMSLDNQDIYLYGIEEITLSNNKSLKEYIEENGIDKFIDTLNYIGDLNDGGTKIYANEYIKVFLCQTTSGCNDIYISSKKIDNEDGFNNGICEKNKIEE